MAPIGRARAPPRPLVAGVSVVTGLLWWYCCIIYGGGRADHHDLHNNNNNNGGFLSSSSSSWHPDQHQQQHDQHSTFPLFQVAGVRGSPLPPDHRPQVEEDAVVREEDEQVDELSSHNNPGSRRQHDINVPTDWERWEMAQEEEGFWDGHDDETFRPTCPPACIRAQERQSSPFHHQLLHKEEEVLPVRICYLLLVHDEASLRDAIPLFRAIRHSHHILLIHLDAKAPSEWVYPSTNSNVTTGAAAELHREMATCSCGMHMYMEARYSLTWSHWSMNEPTLWALQVATSRFAGQWDVWINLSGDTLPVYQPGTLSHMLHRLQFSVATSPPERKTVRGPNFLTSASCETGLLPTRLDLFPTWWHKRRHYTRDESLPWPPLITYTDPPSSSSLSKSKATLTPNDTAATLQRPVPIYFGSQWMILQADFCIWLVQEMNRTDSLPSQFARYLQHYQFLMTDETFIPSLLMAVSPWNETLPRLVDVAHPRHRHYHHQDRKPTDEHPLESDHDDLDHVPHHRVLFNNGTPSHISHVRFERMDEHAPSAFGLFPLQQRYDVPDPLDHDPETGWPRPKKPRPWGPYYLGVYDLATIRRTGALFIRKVSRGVDPNLYHILPVHDRTDIPAIAWPRQSELLLTSKPDWERKIRDLMKAQEEEEEEEEFHEATEDTAQEGDADDQDNVAVDSDEMTHDHKDEEQVEGDPSVGSNRPNDGKPKEGQPSQLLPEKEDEL